MIIHAPTRIASGAHIYLKAHIEADHPHLAALNELWFRVHRQWADALANNADAFLAGMLPIACELGEDIEVRGEVSPRLVHNAREYVRILNAHNPGRQHLIKLRVATDCLLVPTSHGAAHRRVGMGFSGGVDAQYLLWSHLPENEPLPQFRITHALTVNGFDLDVDLQEQGYMPALQAVYAPFFAPLGIEHLVLATNLRLFRQAALGNMVASYASALAACALALSPLFSTFYIASSYKYGSYGTIDDLRPLLDPLLSNEHTAICHGGADATRLERLRAIAEWPASYPTLRVCSNPDHPSINTQTRRVDNCGQCEKCVLTQLALMLLKRSDRYTHFTVPLTAERLRMATLSSKGGRIRAREYLAIAKRQRQDRLAADLRRLYWRSLLSRLRWYLRKPRRLLRR